MTLKLLYIISAILFCNMVRATPQIADLLVYEGDTIRLFNNPLEKFLESNGLNLDRGCNSSGCSRGYIATWIIRNDSLMLVKVQACGVIATAGVYTGLECSDEPSELITFFDEKLSNSSVFADWVSELLISPKGRILKYVHSDYESIFEREIHFEISKGTLISIDTIENDIDDPELIRRYNLNLVTDTLFYSIAKLNWEEFEEERMCADFYLITVNKKGRVTSVKYQNFGESKWEYFWYNQKDFGCRKRIKRAIKNLKFDNSLKGDQLEKIAVKLNLEFSNGELRMTW